MTEEEARESDENSKLKHELEVHDKPVIQVFEDF